LLLSFFQVSPSSALKSMNTLVALVVRNQCSQFMLGCERLDVCCDVVTLARVILG
jgi:hypothetical protein